MTIPSVKPAHILVIKHGAFGDVIQSDGALRDIREYHSDALITVLTTPPYRRIFERCPWVDRVMIDRREPQWRLDHMMRLARTLRAAHFDMVYDLQNSTRITFYRRWLLPGLPWSGETQERTLLFRTKPMALPSLTRWAKQLHAAGVPVHHTEIPDVGWMADNVTGLLDEGGVRAPFIVLIPGSSARHPEKRWPHYDVLAQALLDRGFGVVTAPGPDEFALAKTIPGVTLTGPTGCLDWFQLAGLFARAAFIVGNDTGPTHLAAHGGHAGLGLFGAHMTPEWTGIVRDRFGALAVADLALLPADRVLAEVLARLPA